MQSDLYYSPLYYPWTSFIRGFTFWNQNLVRPSTADNRGLTVYHKYKYNVSRISCVNKIFNLTVTGFYNYIYRSTDQASVNIITECPRMSDTQVDPHNFGSTLSISVL